MQLFNKYVVTCNLIIKHGQNYVFLDSEGSTEDVKEGYDDKELETVIAKRLQERFCKTHMIILVASLKKSRQTTTERAQ